MILGWKVKSFDTMVELEKFIEWDKKQEKWGEF